MNMQESSDKAKEILRDLYSTVRTSDLSDTIPLVYNYDALSTEAKRIITLLLTFDSESFQSLSSTAARPIISDDLRSSERPTYVADYNQPADSPSFNEDSNSSDAVSKRSANLSIPSTDVNQAKDGLAVDDNEYSNTTISSGPKLPDLAGTSDSLPVVSHDNQTSIDSIDTYSKTPHDNQQVIRVQNDLITSEGDDLASVDDSPRASQNMQSQLRIIKKELLLPNAKVNEVYEACFDCDGAKNLTSDANEVPGICIDLDSCVVSGIPAASGDFVIRLRGTLDGYQCEILLSLAVIANPKSLWIAKPSDPTAKYAKPDEHSSLYLTEQMLLLGASKRGRSHAQVGSFRDDDYAVGNVENSQWFYAVVADGAGSASYSRRGSQIVAEIARKSISQLIQNNLGNIDQLVSAYLANEPSAEKAIRNSLYHTLAAVGLKAANCIYEEAKHHEVSEDLFYTTMILAIARRCADHWFVAGFGIGDGGAGVLDLSTNSIAIINKPDSGDYGGQTRFLQGSMFKDTVDISQRIFFDIRQHIDAVVLMTDGITDPKFPTDNVLSDFSTWDDFWRNDLSAGVSVNKPGHECEQQLLDWLDFWSPGNHDDRTIVLMIPVGETDADH